MSPICQTFVQNAWKKDLCSNCFKTEDEHGRKTGGGGYLCHPQASGSGYDSSDSSAISNNGGGRRKHPITSAILSRADSRTGERSMGDGGTSESSPSGTTPTTSSAASTTTPQSRYVGVANSRMGYQRNYYGSVGGGSPWKSRLGDASEASGLKSPSLLFRSDSSSNAASGLRSPALIKGISSSSSSSSTISNGHSNEHSSNSDLSSTKLSPVPLSKNNETISGSSSSLSSSTSSPPVMLPRTYFPSSANERPSKFLNSSPEFSNSVEEKNQKNTELTNNVRHQFLFGESSHSPNSLSSPRGQNAADVIRRSNLSSSEHRSDNARGLRYSSQSISNSTEDYTNRPVRSRSADNILATPVKGAKSYDERPMGYSSVHTAKRVECEVSSSADDVSSIGRDDQYDNDHVRHHNDSGILSANVSSEANDSTDHNTSSYSSSNHNTSHASSTINNHSRFSSEYVPNSAGESRRPDKSTQELSTAQNSHRSSLERGSEGETSSSSSSSCADSETSEATSVADSTESDDHCGGFYNIEGLGGDEDDSDEEGGGGTNNRNESSTDDGVQEDKMAQLDDTGAPSDESVLEDTASTIAEECDVQETKPHGKKSCLSSKKSTKSLGSGHSSSRNITFNPSDQVIGYGGDVDYSDDEDEDDDDDDDDDNDSLMSFELTQREKLLKKLTLQNTDFNAENDNFGDEVVLQDDHYELIKKYEQSCEGYDIYEDMKSTFDATKCLRSQITPERGSDVKVKLRRSTPLVSVKPFISRSLSSGTESPKVNPVLPMKNGELIRTRSDGSPLDREIVPLQGIKPKYVSKEEEIVEKDSDAAMFEYGKGRVTSFGSNADSGSSERVTSFGSESPSEKVTSFGSESSSGKVTSFGSESSPGKVTSFGSESSPEKVTSFGSESLPEKVTSFGPENPKEKITSFGIEESSSEQITSNNNITNSVSKEKNSTSRGKSENIEKVTQFESTTSQVTRPSPISTSLAAHETPVVKPVRQKKKSKFLPGSQSASNKTQEPTPATSKDIGQYNIQTNNKSNSKLATELSKKTSEVLNNKIVKNELVETGVTKTETRNPATIVSAVSLETTDAHLGNRSSAKSNSAKTEPSNEKKVSSSAKNVATDRNKASRSSISKESSVGRTQGISEVAARISKERKADISSPRSTGNKTDTSSPQILERKSETCSPVEIKASPCKRRSSFMASQLGITDLEEEVSTPVASTPDAPVETTSTIPLKLVDVDLAASSVQPIYTQQRSISVTSNTSQNQSESENVSCAVIKKSARSRRGGAGGISGDKDVWSDTASNSTDNDEIKSSSSSEIYRDASSQQGSSSSHRSSTSSLMTTFGTPVANGSTPPQPSFLHSEAARAIYETPSSVSPEECTTTGYTTSQEFLKEIKAPADQPAPTAGIQKSGFYASSSCLKGLPGSSRPVQTPRPPSVSRQSSSDTNYSSVSGVAVSPTTHVARNLSSTFATMAAPDALKVLPNIPAPDEVVYDLPVTVAQNSVNPTTGSLHYSTSSLLTEDNKVSPSASKSQEESPSEIYYEVDLHDDDDEHHYQVADDIVPSRKVVEKSAAPVGDAAKSRFEAKRSFISSNLNMNMLAPQCSQEDEEELYQISNPVQSLSQQLPGQPQEDSEFRTAHFDSTSSRPQQQRTLQDPPTRNLPNLQLPDILQGQPILPHPAGEHSSQSDPSQFQGEPIPGSRPTDVDSYSSFTDDFDEDDDEEVVSLTDVQEGVEDGAKVDKQQALAAAVAEGILNSSDGGLRRVGERSSSATPFFRNSVGPTNYDATGIRKHLVSTPSAFLTLRPNKKDKGRSHSCPRNADHVIVSTPLPQQLPPQQQQKTSKFSFVKASFFRPTSPPPASTQAPTAGAARGRDRSKKTSLSRFSLKKFLRLGSSSSSSTEAKEEDEEKKAREALKQAEREAKKSKLNIIHPLDYNKTAVQVIARPEKTAPAYDYANMHGFSSANKLTKEAITTTHQQQKQQSKKQTPGTEARAKSPTAGSPQDFGRTEGLSQDHGRRIQDHGRTSGTTSPAGTPGPTAAELMYQQSKEKHLQQLAQQQQQQHSSQQQRHSMLESVNNASNSPAGVTNNIGASSATTTTRNQVVSPPIIISTSSTRNQALSPPIYNSPTSVVSQSSVPIIPRRPTSPISAPLILGATVSPSSSSRGPTSPSSVAGGTPKFPGGPMSPNSIVGGTPKVLAGAEAGTPNTPGVPLPSSSAAGSPPNILAAGGAVSNPPRGPPSTVAGSPPNVLAGGAVSTPPRGPPSTSAPPFLSAGGRSSSVPSVQPFTLNTVSPGSVAATVVPLRRNTSFNTGPEGRLERRASSAGDGASLARASCPQGLGFNSEGRPKPPPPPRKTSLEQRQQQQREDVIYQVPVVRDYNQVPPIQENKQQQQQQLLHKDLQQRIQSIMSDGGVSSSNKLPKPQSSAKQSTSESSTNVVPGSGASQPGNAIQKAAGTSTAPPRPEAPKKATGTTRPGPPPVPASKPRLTGSSPSSSPANVVPPQPVNKNGVSKGPPQHRLVRQNAQEDRTENSPDANHATESRADNSRNPVSSNGNRVTSANSTSDSRTVETRGSAVKPSTGATPTRKPAPTGTTNGSNAGSSTSSSVPPKSYCPRSTTTATGRTPLRTPANPALSPNGGRNGGGGVCSPIRPKAPPVLPARTCGGLPGGNQQPPPVPTRDSVYANLGDVRAPFTPRKPGRASSLRDDEKKAAPQSLQEGGVTSEQTSVDHQPLPHQDPLYDSPATITHEALTKLMNKVCSGSSLPSQAYASVARETRSWQDVALRADAPPVKAGLRVFQCGSVRQTPVTVVITPEPTLEPHPLLGPPPLAVLKEARVGGTVWVLPRLVLHSLPQYRALLADHLITRPGDTEAQQRTLALVLLQLVAAFKQLQARGIEEASLDLLLLAAPEQSDRGTVPRLVVAAPAPACPFPLPASPSPLCQVAVAAAENLGATLSSDSGSRAAAVFGATVAVLRQERAGSLTKAQCLLEAFIFGPLTGDENSLGEDRLQRWLDAERASFLRSLSNSTSTPREGSRSTDASNKTSPGSTAYDVTDGNTELIDGVLEGDEFELEGADGKVYHRRVSLEEKFKLMFLVRTNVRSLAQSLTLIKN